MDGMDKIPEANILIIFGASGDLTYRKLVPALSDLFSQNLLGNKFYVLGVGRTEFSDADFMAKMKEGIGLFAQKKEHANDFLDRTGYLQLDTFNLGDYSKLKIRIEELISEGFGKNLIFYLSTPPNMFKIIAEGLGNVGLTKQTAESGFRRIIIEKPFGTDLQTAKDLNIDIRKHFQESQIYRIDHYLGKETVQNLLVTRFSNTIFEPLWNRNFISHIEITATESIGVGSRAGYYEKSGAIRDMFQNHLLQVLALVAMEPPAIIEADSIRTESLKVLQSIRPISQENFNKEIIRGQYTSSLIRGEKIPGYRDEKNVNPESRTETFLAAKLLIDNWRWAGVPFFVRTGKRMPTRVTEIVINFRSTPHHLFHKVDSIMNSKNQLIIRIQPDEGILLNFGMKLPGAGYNVKMVGMDFHYSDLSSTYVPTAYERLLLDCMLGDATLFSRGDIVETAWKLVQPVLDRWDNDSSIPLYGYPAGIWGPKEAEHLLEGMNTDWRYPCKNLSNNDEYCEL